MFSAPNHNLLFCCADCGKGCATFQADLWRYVFIMSPCVSTLSACLCAGRIVVMDTAMNE